MGDEATRNSLKLTLDLTLQHYHKPQFLADLEPKKDIHRRTVSE